MLRRENRPRRSRSGRFRSTDGAGAAPGGAGRHVAGGARRCARCDAAFGPLTLAAHGGAARLLAALGEVDHGMAFDDPSAGLAVQRPRSGRDPSEPIVAWLNADGAAALEARAGRGAIATDRRDVHCAAVPAARRWRRSVHPTRARRAAAARYAAVSPTRCWSIPGSGSAAKNWPAGRFAATIDALDGSPVRLIVGEADAAAARRLKLPWPRPLPRLEHPPLDELAAAWPAAGPISATIQASATWPAVRRPNRRPVRPHPPAVWRPLGPDVQRRAVRRRRPEQHCRSSLEHSAR